MLSPYWWLWRARRSKRRTPASTLWDNRRRLIRDLAPGKSFIDVGGMFGIDGEAAFLAEDAGARQVVLYDAMDPSDRFQEAHGRRSSSVHYVQGDLHDRASIDSLGSFEIVWCAGIIYHSPSPFLLLEHLRHITTERLLLGTHLIPEIRGFEQACLWYPGLPARLRKALAWAHGDEAPQLLGIGSSFSRIPAMGYTNFWWGISLSALRAMLDVARFEIVEECLPHPMFIDVLAQPSPSESVTPPPAFSRDRGERRISSFGGAAPLWA